MIIPNKVFKKWNDLKSEGDYGKIAAIANVSHQNIFLAFKNKKCSDEVFMAIGKFYDEKLEKIKQYI